MIIEDLRRWLNVRESSERNDRGVDSTDEDIGPSIGSTGRANSNDAGSIGSGGSTGSSFLLSGLQPLYDRYLREHLPRRPSVYNGVAHLRGRLLDLTLVDQNYKSGTIEPLRKWCQPSDHVVTIGGGFGVSAVVAARHADDVTVFEAGEEYADIVRETAWLNRETDTIDVREAVVAEGRTIYGESIADTTVAPADLPACDVLEMDCEGTEVAILDGLTDWPRVIIVECHPAEGVDPQAIRADLKAADYEIVAEHETEYEEATNVTYTGVRNS